MAVVLQFEPSLLSCEKKKTKLAVLHIFGTGLLHYSSFSAPLKTIRALDLSGGPKNIIHAVNLMSFVLNDRI